jgi:chemotaxis family two-component system sensor kinase Cph1
MPYPLTSKIKMNSETFRSINKQDMKMVVDLSNCEREPIHIPGLIQPHGVLFALTVPSLSILQVSSNTQVLLGREPQLFLGQLISDFLPPEQADMLLECLQQEDVEIYNPLQITIQVEGSERAFDGIIHHVEGGKDRVALLELEAQDTNAVVMLPRFYHIMRRSTTVLQGASDLQALSQTAAQIIHDLTGFDRVMIYRFHPDWHGEVIAEVKDKDLEPYLGLHYPASDIPSQARELYRRNWLRLIADVAYEPVPIVPTDNPTTGQPLNLSNSVLRSVSPMHIQYLKNMGVGASMSVSILKNNQLWGLISCHHRTARYVLYTARAACEFLGQLFSLQISAREDVDDYAYRTHVRELYDRVAAGLLRHDDIVEGLRQDGQTLMEMVSAQGVVFSFRQDEQQAARYLAVGITPEREDVQALIEWLQQERKDALFATDVLPTLVPDGERFRDRASGILALSVASWRNGCVLWFRPEVLQEVHWGGDPDKPVQAEGDTLVLRPRTSFNAWLQTVRGTSLPWKTAEIEAVRDLRGVITDRLLRMLLLQRSQELMALNDELEKSNNELDSFAYSVSHDLKEPLRGINNYVHILKEDYGTVLDEEGVSRLDTLTRLTRRLESLIDGLLRYSRVGHVDLSFAQVNLNTVVSHAVELVQYQLNESGIKIRVPRPLPVVYCDQARVGEIFSNLITNAIKYSGDKPEKWIEVGYLDGDEHHQGIPVFYVRDNGIGIQERYFAAIFQIFRRLHARDKFGGGTGVGLSIVKRIVERHGGRIWVESRFKEGTTFYFTLQDEKGQRP